MNIEFDNVYGSSDAVGATTGLGALGYSFYFRNSSKFALHGSKALRGSMGIMIDNCTDADVQWNVVALHRDDGIRVQNGCTQVNVTNNRVTDTMGQGRIYYDPVNGGTPDFSVAHGGTYTFSDVSHADAISAYRGIFTALRIQNNLIEKYWGQGGWLPDASNTFNGLIFSDNDIECAMAYAFAIGNNITNLEVSGNIIRLHPLPNPTFVRHTVSLATQGGTTGWHTDGQNVFPVGTSVVGATGVPLTAMNLTSGAPNGPGSAVTFDPPAFTQTDATVADLDTLRVTRPDYTIHSGTPIPSPKFAPVILGPGTGGAGPGAYSSYPLNSYLAVKPGPVEGYYTDVEETYKTRWRMGATVVQASTTGSAGMKYRATVAGSVTPDIDYGDGVWVAGNTVAIA